MDLPDRWTLLDGATQRWLIDHNGEPVPADVVTELVKAGGAIPADAWWLDEVGAGGSLVLSDAATDWIETVANAE